MNDLADLRDAQHCFAESLPPILTVRDWSGLSRVVLHDMDYGVELTKPNSSVGCKDGVTRAITTAGTFRATLDTTAAEIIIASNRTNTYQKSMLNV